MNNSIAVVRKADYSPEELAVIEKQFFPQGTSIEEQRYCFAVAKELGLNPITKEVYFVQRRQRVGDRWTNKVEPMVGRDGFLSIGHRTGQFAGMETVASIKPVPRMIKGAWVYSDDLVAECKVWRSDTPRYFSAEVSWSEYVQKTSDGQPTKFWAEKPETMIKKVAESQALRKAFNIHGVYAPEELGAGFESDEGELILEAEFTRTDEKKSSDPPPAISPPPATTQPPAAPRSSRSAPKAPPPPAPPPATLTPPKRMPAPPPAPFPEDDGWPDPPPHPGEEEQDGPGDEVGVRDEILALLKGKKIPYEVDEESGQISAKSYNDKDLLKQVGFRWSGETKTWHFNYKTQAI